MDASAVIPVVIAFVGVVVWAVRLEGRVNAHDRAHEEHKQRHEELRSDLTYIRERIDRALNGRGAQ